MVTIASLRSGRPDFYPDQALYAEYAARHFGLDFDVHDEGAGFVFSVHSKARHFYFGGGKCPVYPQNDSTSSFLATDKYFANLILSTRAIPNTGGNYFFLNDRFRKFRSPGHEASDALLHFQKLGSVAFLKPLLGSRGDFAQLISSESGLSRYIADVSRYYDSIIMQPVYKGREYRIFVLDGEILYCARKHEPVIAGDGRSTIRELVAGHARELEKSGISSAVELFHLPAEPGLDRIPDADEHIVLPGRRNRSAGGAMVLECPQNRDAAFRLAVSAASVLNLNVAGVDVFEDDSAAEDARIRIIEVNANPAIRLLEDIGREDLILAIWRSTFRAVGLINARQV
jgi:glutathione synthase/RimK-type ligase-like ATP-grasp enzyme